MKSFGQILRITLRERIADPSYLGSLVNVVLLDVWNDKPNDKIISDIVDEVLRKASSDGTFGLCKRGGKDISISMETDEERNDSLLEIKIFVDELLATCMNYAEKHKSKGSRYMKLSKYFGDLQRVRILYSALVMQIAKKLGFPIPKNWETATGFTPSFENLLKDPQ
ncbi:MAG: hypothetical protein FWB86_04410 [Treponema sp.]|nr:hypothetical protein [Treponema sp.]